MALRTHVEQLNRLERESSPFLKQHVHDPVDWYPWGSEAFEKARDLDRPIFLSIGYSSCHWCHVMREESFEDEETAELLNELFVNIKVDREERPDIDALYMEAIQAMTGKGGWPLNIFLTPNLKPFFGGTYFPKEDKDGRPSFKKVLNAVASYFMNSREEAEKKASDIIRLLSHRSSFMGVKSLETRLDKGELNVQLVTESLDSACSQLQEQLMEQADKKCGGFGNAPKFPMPSLISACLNSPYDDLVEHGIRTLNYIRSGGILDQIGGGISRYSTDVQWRVPHFEKMLYDNTQILPLYVKASRKCKQADTTLSREFSRVAHAIYDYLETHLVCPDTQLYYCSEDAVSEGEQGGYYVFENDEIDEIFESSHDRQFVRAWFKITKKGNFEGHNVLAAPENTTKFAAQIGVSLDQLEKQRKRCTEKLLKYRSGRIPPVKDNKILMGWNALAAINLMQAGVEEARFEYLARAISLLGAIRRSCFVKGKYWHLPPEKSTPRIPAFCDDLSWYFGALVEALLLTGEEAFLKEALQVANVIHGMFVDPSEGTLYYATFDPSLVFRPLHPEDGVMPSAQSTLFRGCEILLSWVKAQNLEDHVFSRSHSNMIEALSLIAVGNGAILAHERPTASSSLLDCVRWYRNKRFILLESCKESPIPGGYSCPLDTISRINHIASKAPGRSIVVGRELKVYKNTYDLWAVLERRQPGCLDPHRGKYSGHSKSVSRQVISSDAEIEDLISCL